MRRWFSGETPPEPQEPIEVYGLPLLHGDRGRGKAMRVLFTNDEDFAREPIFLRKMWDRVWALDEEADMKELGKKVRDTLNWTFPDFQTPLATLPDGFHSKMQFWTIDVVVPRKVLEAGYVWEDLNAGILRLEFAQTGVTLLGSAPADRIARRRLKRLEEKDARRVDTQLVHANHLLFERRNVGGPCLVLVAFDRSTPRSQLEETAEVLHEWRDWETDDPELLEVAKELASGEEHWHYHHRFRVPDSLTNGFEIYAADLWIHRPYLRRGQFFADDEEESGERTLPCLAEPGDKGGIELLPFDEIDTFTRRR